MIKPYYQENGIQIFNADCKDILPTLSRVDLVLTDPPYGIGIANNPVRQKHARMSWDNATPDKSTFDLMMKISRYQIIWGGNYFGLPATQCFFVWDKVQPESFSLSMCEQAWTNITKPAKLFRRRVVSYIKEHPTEKPIELMRWCIVQPLEPCNSILDPFMGSGTTLVAAKQLGRKAIGIEISKDYCDIAIERLRQNVFDFDQGGNNEAAKSPDSTAPLFTEAKPSLAVCADRCHE